jgi:hypothetical protein
MPHPARKIAGLTVGGSAVGIAIPPQPGFSSGKLLKISYWNPGVVALISLQNRTQEITKNRHSQNGAYRAVDQQRDLEKEFSS